MPGTVWFDIAQDRECWAEKIELSDFTCLMTLQHCGFSCACRVMMMMMMMMSGSAAGCRGACLLVASILTPCYHGRPSSSGAGC
jgi:hypothetical protein